MDAVEDGTLDVDMLADDGSEEESEVPPSSAEFYQGPGSTPTSCASSPRGEEAASPAPGAHPAFLYQQPYARPFFTSGRRGPGRPRKEGPKLTREGKIVRRYRGNAGSLRGAKRHRGSRDDALDEIMDEDDFTMPAPEEPPYMPEKWPGKTCALCNLSERSQLGQGEMRQLPGEAGGAEGQAAPHVPPAPSAQSAPPGGPEPAADDPQVAVAPLSRRQKAFNKCKTPLYNMEHTDELSIIGHVETLDLAGVSSGGAFYVHRLCVEFSPPFQEYGDKDEVEETRVKGIVVAALARKCAFCTRYGASIPCKMSCNKYFHLACVLASGGFMDFHIKAAFCKDHLYQVPVICTSDIECRTCHTIGDLANLMTCAACGAHYHGTCVGLAQLPGVRAGWCCRACRVCQVCRADGGAGGGAGGDARAVACEHCDKLYHAACLRPVMATVPKYGWKCKCCRVCSDCGSRSPGAGPSSRWHAHYTVCDSCYQQRNKGSCCPLCRRAYRASAYRDMIRCRQCRRYVHGTCDPDAEPAQFRLKKEQNPAYEYSCPICKTQLPAAGSKPSSFEDDSMASTSQDSSFGDENSQQEQDPLAIEAKTDVGLGKGKPYTVSSKVAKKKLGGGYKVKGGFPPAGKLGFKKRQRSALEFGRKRGSKPKMRGVFGVPGLGLQRPMVPDNKTTEEDPGVENKLVLCSSKDKFVLTQDLCVMCGAVGTDSEGCLIVCAQCGQSYHPYCVNIKVSAAIVNLGWRCLECTVCEGCGSRGDEGLLVLCDDCDTAWHTYCARPGLADVPRGAWRCERCRRCHTCGARQPPCWTPDYTECGPCASLVMCCVCAEPYSDGELIIQCEGCRRWLHAACDAIRAERDADVCCRAGYKCVLCRGRDVPPPHLARAAPPAAPRPAARPTPQSLGLAGEYYIDDVCLSQRGAHHMKQLEAEMGITHTRRKRRFKNDNAEKDAVVQNADDMVDDSKPDSTAEVKEEPGAPSNLKEGLLWNVTNDGPPPEGFTIYTTDSGLTVLRRKRQRNLNKLGIGGFVVRQRQNTKNQQDDDNADLGESPGNKRKPRRKPRSKLMEQFPSYMQEAFFGKELLEPTKPAISSTGTLSESPGLPRAPTPEGYRELRDFKFDVDNSDSDGEDVLCALSAFSEHDRSTTITLSKEEIDLLNSLKPKDDKEDKYDTFKIKMEASDEILKHTEDSSALRNAIMGPAAEPEPPAPPDAIPTVHGAKAEAGVSETGGSSQASTISPKDELSLLGVNLDAMVRESLPDMDSNDVDEIFKGVLTDDSQESQESSVSFAPSLGGTTYAQRPQLQSPMDYAPSYSSEFGSGSSSALSPLFPEGGAAGAWPEQPAPPPSYNQRSTDKMGADESLGSAATISAVLYANTNHPEWKTEFPNWLDRCRQILKKWRSLPAEQKQPYLQRARDNRSAIRMKKAQQEQERACGQQRSAREAEQERQWKLLQQQRQQQTQQQQQIIHDQRMQGVAGGAAGGAGAEAPRSAFPAQRFPLYASDDINRQLRDLLQRQTDKMWPHAGTPGAAAGGPGGEGPQFRPPLPVGLRPRAPLHHQLRPEQQLIMQQRIVSADGQIQQTVTASAQQIAELKQNLISQQNAPSTEPKTEPGQDQGTDEMDMGDMDKLEQDTGNIGEVGDILTGLGGEDDEELLESLTAEIGEQFNILEYADPELAALHDAEHILDGLELDDRAGDEGKPDNKMDSELQKAVKNIEAVKAEVKSEMDEIKCEDKGEHSAPQAGPLFSEGVQRTIITQNQQIALQNAMLKADVKSEGEESQGECEWRSVQAAPRPVFTQQMFPNQHQQQQVVASRAAFPGAPAPRQFAQQHHLHFAQGGAASGGNIGVSSAASAAAQIVSAMTAQVNAALAAGRSIAPGTRLVGADGAVGVVRHDRSVQLHALPHALAHAAGAGPARAPPPPPYPGTLRQAPPPPPYPQEQPLLLEDLLEQEKREQERSTPEWAGPAAPAAPPAPAVPPYAAAPPPAPPAPPPGDERARRAYEAWLKQFNAFAADQLRYYEAEMLKLRKIRKSLNSKQRQLRKSGNELLAADAAELARVAAEQAALQKPLEAARKQARQHSMLVQEYETKQRQQNPQLVQQTVLGQPQLAGQGFPAQARPGQLGLSPGLRGPAPRPLGPAPQPRAPPPVQPHSPLHHLTSPLQSPLHHPPQSPLQSPLHSAQSPLHVTQTSLPQQSPLHQSPLHHQQSPLHQSPMQMQPQHSPMHPQQSPIHVQQSPMHQSPHHPQQSPHHPQQSPHHPQQSPHHPQQSPHHPQQSPHHPQQSPHHPQQSPHHPQQSPMQSPLQSSMSPQHFLQQLQQQRTSPQLPTPSRSPQIYQQSQIQSPVSSHSPLQNTDYTTGRFSRPAPGCSPLPPRFARAPHHQQGMRVGVPFGARQQTSPLGSPQPMPSPGNPANEMARQQMLQRQQYSPMGGAPPSPSLRSPHVTRTPPAAPSPAASPSEHGGGQHPPAPIPPGYRYCRAGLLGGAPVWPQDNNRPLTHVAKVSILKRARPRYTGKTAAPTPEPPTTTAEAGPSAGYVLYSDEDVKLDTTPQIDEEEEEDDDDDDDVEEYVEHLDDDDIVVVEPGAASPPERIATEEDFEELIDSGKPDDEEEEPAMRTETTTKTVAVISLATKPQYQLVTPRLLSSVHGSGATVASVSIANQTISVPVLQSLAVPVNVKPQMKKLPLPLSLSTQSGLSKPITSVISVISSNVAKTSMNPVITLDTSNASGSPSRVPVSILTQHQVKQKIVKTIEKPMALSLSNTKLSSLSVSHDATLPAKIFQDDAASPDSTVAPETIPDKDHPVMTIPVQQHPQSSSHHELKKPIIRDNKDIDIETEISQQTELPHTYITERTPLLMGKAEIKSPDPVPEKIPDNIMEGDDDDKEDSVASNLLLAYKKELAESTQCKTPTTETKKEEKVVKTITAIANQTKDMVIDSNMQITSEMAQESVQISIPSPTPSQERYLNDITMQEHQETVDGNPKRVDIEDMLCMLENISDNNAAKSYGMKQQNIKLPNSNPLPPQPQPAQSAPPPPEQKESQEPPQPPPFPKREPERLNIQAATVPQLSPLSQPAELTSNMANVSQQLRTIMSSLNTNTSKVDTQTATTVLRKNSDTTTPTQVNFENLLPSSKVEVAISRPSPVQQRIEKPITSMQSVENLPMSASQMVGSRVNALSSMSQIRKSPTVSPINSPVGIQSQLMKSPAQSPLITHQTFNPVEDNATSISSQVIQMPALSKIHSNLSAPQTMILSNTITTSVNNFQKAQVLPTSILGHTLLQPTRQMNPNLHFGPQSISTSQPPALVMTSRPIIGNKEVPPNVTMRTHSIVSPGISQAHGVPTKTPINFITSSKLLHTQLTSPLKRSKSTDEPKSEVIVGHIQPTKRHSVESVIVKSEPMETDDANTTTIFVSMDPASKQVSLPQGAANQRNDESQNVLLKQLLQTTTTAANVVPQRTITIQRTAPALGTIASLEAQLARPSIPPPTLMSQEVEIPKSSPRHTMASVNTSFATRPMQAPIPTSSMSPLIQTSTQSLMDIRKQTPMKIMTTKEETTPMPESSPTMKTIQQHMYPIMNIENQQLHQAIKKEIAPPQQSPVHRPFTPMDVKKELLDESSQQSATSGISTASDQGKLDQPMKEEYPESVSMDQSMEPNAPETPSEAKKRKRREYQQKKRKQMQMNMKAAAENSMNAATAKKRPRKGSRYEEDYDTFIDNLMAQLRLLPPMQIQEPALTTNFSVCPLFGSGDLTKLKNKDYDILKGDLTGEFGNAKIPNVADYYNTKPFGDDEPFPEKPQTTTQRGFYDQEFQPIVFEEDPEDKKLDFICKERDTDTPDSIISCSSHEGNEIDPGNRFPGLKLIDDEDEDDDSDSAVSGRMSPIIPLIAPVPIRLKPVSLYVKEEDDNSKALKCLDANSPHKNKMDDSPGGTESNENVTVTLTLTSGAAEDILGVLKELAGILHIPPPTSYQIVERTATPPSHKLGLYRSKGKDGKEGTPIDIQSILNGAAKFCRHCDVVILDSVVRAKASEFPLLSANKGNAEEILCDSDSELFFCSTQCYERFAWRPTNIILDGKSKNATKDDSKSDIDTNISKERDDFDTASTESMETDDLDIKPDIKDEKMDLSFMDSLDNDELMKEVGDDVSALDEDLKSVDTDEKSNQSVEKEKDKYRGIKYKAWSPGCIGPTVKYKKPTDRELTELVFRTGVAIMPVTNEDVRKCELCGIQGDGVADGVSRLLNCDVDRWVHLNCALWSEGVYETVSGALMNVETALATGSNATCAVCRRLGATVRCYKVRCGSVYHLGCAVKDNCVFYKNKSAYCASHAPKGEKENELTTLSVQRRVYVSRDEQRQVASVMLHSDTNHLIRVGGLIFLSPGYLLPHQLAAFHTPNYIYPPGYKIVRFYWSMSRANSRCRYLCWISEEEGRPRFHVRAQDEGKQEVTAATPRAAWAHVLDAVAALREARQEEGVLKLWPNYVTGEDLFGLAEPCVVRVLESLPGIETLSDYRFKFGRSALLEGGLAVNPSGCARCEPRGRAAWRRPARSLPPASAAPPPDAQACPYTKQFVHTKSSQYKKMKLEWRNNVYLARSKIQGLGLYAARDIEKHTMVIEYIGEIIRSELSEIREKQYEAKNRGTYMFRLDERRVVDATLSGGLARYINHSCQPNCVAECVEVDRQLRIIIFAKRRISRGEELAYDYKFDIEDDAHKIMCMCGALNCRKWMN